MFTPYDKAITALLMGIVNLLLAFGIELPAGYETVVVALGTIIGAGLVYMIPNKNFVRTDQ